MAKEVFIVQLEDTPDQREIFAETVMALNFTLNPDSKNPNIIVTLLAAENIPQLDAVLAKLTEEKKQALVFMDGYLGNSDSKGEKDLFEGVRKGIQLIREASFPVIFLSAGASLIPDFISKEMIREFMNPTEPEYQLVEKNTTIESQRGSGLGLNLKDIVGELQNRAKIRQEKLAEAQKATEHFNKNYHGLISRPYDALDQLLPVLQIYAETGQVPFVMFNIVGDSGLVMPDLIMESAQNYFTNGSKPSSK
jgi:hypothetical protein